MAKWGSGVTFVGIDLDHRASVHHNLVIWVMAIGVIGMGGVCTVGGDTQRVRIGVDNESFEDRIEQRRVGSGGAGAANFLVVKERNNLRARCVGLDERLDASPTRQLIVDARRGHPFVVPAAKRWRHDIVGHELKSENVVGSDSEVGGKQLHQACLLVVIVGKPPHGLKVGLFVEFETLGGYLAVEVDRELGYTQNWTVNLDQVRGHVSGHDLAREPEVPIEPAIDECTAIDLDAKLANTSRHAVGMRLDT